MSSSPEPSSSPTNGLYCGEDAREVVPSNTDDSWVNDQPQPSFSSGFLPQTDETYITNLIDSEPHFMPQSDYLHRCRNRSVDVTARQDSINWILKVHGYYRFRPVTAMLSVNYFDRFLSSHSFPVNGWPFQLLSVACLSLAAKMEETHVPLLVNLQVLEPGFVFEPKTVQRMELWVMVNLDWRLRSVTPFDYLHYFISKLPSCDFNRIFEFSSALILSTTRVIDFLGFSPSTLAEAAVLCAAGERFDATPTGGDGEYYHSFNDRAKKEMVRSCHQLMEEYLIDTCPSARLKVPMAEPLPPSPSSPVGVLDAAACGSCDTRSENPGSSNQAGAQQLAKRPRSSAPDAQPP